MSQGLPWRGPGRRRPELPLPPGKVPLRRNGTWRKHWRYLGVFADELLLCAARVGSARSARPSGRSGIARRARCTSARGSLAPGARGEVWTERADDDESGRIDWAPDRGDALVRIEAAPQGDRGQVRAFLRVGEGDWARASVRPARTTATSGPASGSCRSTCDVRIGERRIRIEARGVEDESCGYHPRHTVWDWSAGVGVTHRRPRGRLEPGQGHQRPAAGLRARDLGRRRRLRARPVALRGPRRDRLRRRPGSSSAPSCERRSEEKRRVRQLQLPPAVRHLHRHAARRDRARARAFGVMEHHDAHW